MIKSWLKKYKLLLIIVLIPYLFLITTLSFPLKNYSVTLPGGIHKIDKGIEIDNTTSHNDFYSVYVISYDKPTLFQLWLSSLTKKSTISKNSYTFNLQEAYRMGLIDEELSYQYGIIYSYLEASKINSNISINYRLKGYIIETTLAGNGKLGDIIIKFDGSLISDMSPSEVNAYFTSHEVIELTVLRNNKEVSYQINKTDEAKFMMTVMPFYEIHDTTPSYQSTYQDDFIVGPSGGLLQALNIYSSLLNIDYNGLIISGTGTIDIDGNVGKIGGIKEKIYSVNGKVDVFFCPEDNYSDALEAYYTLKSPSFELVKVGHINEAIEYLS
ncbi:MAG: S16 family serine protease [Acholeplasmataceae bacterium]|nr:S16 family serine protease [Acholeplasmatales bacterium]